MVIKVRGDFDCRKCFECEVFTVCKAGQLVDAVMGTMEDEASAVYDSYHDQFIEALGQGNPEVETLSRRIGGSLVNASTRCTEVRAGLNIMLRRSVRAQTKWDSRFIENDPRGDALKMAALAFDDTPYPYYGEPDTETLQDAATSIVHYAQEGICNAIDIIVKE